MGIKNYGKLTKLQIMAEDTKEIFEVMFNPESYSETFAVTYQKVENINGGLEEYRYVKTPPQNFKLKLIIDGTGVTDYDSSFFPVLGRTNKSVYDQVGQFLKLAWYPVNGKAIPLQITWGSKLTYYCMLKEVTINYTLFDRDGNPLRAELDVNFISNPEKNQKQYEIRLQPDKANATSGTTASATSSTGTVKVGNGAAASTTQTNNGIVINVS
jgi:hypothetical protein